MRKIAALLMLLCAFAGVVMAHGGKSHRLMGTVESLVDNRLTLTTTDGKEAAVDLNGATKLEKDEKPADRSALVRGARVSIQLDETDKIAVMIKIGGGGEEHHGH